MPTNCALTSRSMSVPVDIILEGVPLCYSPSVPVGTHSFLPPYLMFNLLRSFWVEDESGQGLSEYGMIIALVAIALIVALVAFKDKLVSLFTNSANSLPDGTTTTAP